MDLVEVGERSVARRHVAELPERRDVAVHRVDRLEADECRPGAADLAEVPLEVGGVIVAEDPLLGPAPADPLDHRGVVLLVGQDRAAGEEARDRADRGLVGSVAGSEQEGGWLRVKVGQLPLQEHVHVRGSSDVAGASRAGSDALQGLGHGLEHEGVLAHSEVVVRAPHRDLDRTVGPVPGGAGEAPAVALQIREDAVAPLDAQPGEGVG